MLQFHSDSPLLQVVAVGVGPVPVVEPQAPEEALLVEDERQASTLVVHLVLLRRVQVHGAAPKEKSGGGKGSVGSVKLRPSKEKQREAAHLLKKASVSVRFSVHAGTTQPRVDQWRSR